MLCILFVIVQLAIASVAFIDIMHYERQDLSSTFASNIISWEDRNFSITEDRGLTAIWVGLDINWNHVIHLSLLFLSSYRERSAARGSVALPALCMPRTSVDPLISGTGYRLGFMMKGRRQSKLIENGIRHA